MIVCNDQHERQPAPGRGFTLIELLIAISLIIVLLSLVIVALNQSQRAAQRANSQALMNSLKQGLVRFREDVGYLPPVLDGDRALLDPPPLNVNTFDAAVQDWWSATSLAEYLIGYDSGPNDGFGAKDPSQPPESAIEELPFPGIRHPGPDGVWGAGPGGSVASRNPPVTGKVFGPYLELDNPRLLVAVDYSVSPPRIYNPGEANYDNFPKAIADYWGNPIIYYRRAYPEGGLNQSYRVGVDRNGNGTLEPHEQRIPSLSDVILLRPQQLPEAEVVQDAITFGGQLIDITSFELRTAEFALFSSGPDRQFNRRLRIDDPDAPGNAVPPALPTEFANRDNIVETGK